MPFMARRKSRQEREPIFSFKSRLAENCPCNCVNQKPVASYKH